jgi:hypothetical protein
MDRMNEKRAWIQMDSTMLALLLTALAYAAAFNFEFGYISYFGLPSALAEVTLRSLVLSVILLSTIPALAFILQVMLVHLLEVLLKIKVPLIVSMFVMAAIFFALLAALFDLKWFYWAVAGGLLLVAATHLVAPIFVSKKQSTYAEKLMAADARTKAAFMPPSVPRSIGIAMLVIMIAAMTIRTAQDAGRSEARTQKQFLVANISPPCVIVRAYGEALICAQYEGNKLHGKFRLLSKVEPNTELELRRIGPFEPIPNDETFNHYAL